MKKFEKNRKTAKSYLEKYKRDRNIGNTWQKWWTNFVKFMKHEEVLGKILKKFFINEGFVVKTAIVHFFQNCDKI